MEVVNKFTLHNLKNQLPPESTFLNLLRNGEEMRTFEIEKERYLIENLIAEGTFTVLGGEEGVGKSMFLMNLGMGLASGMQQFLGWGVKAPAKVLYLNNEMGYSKFIKRFQSMANGVGTLSLEKFSMPQHFPHFDIAKGPLIEYVTINNPDLIIFDCLYLMHDANENDASEMKSFIRDVAVFAREFNAAIILAHHVKKGNRDNPLNSHRLRGSTALTAYADNVFILTRDDKKETDRFFSIVKTRDLPDSSRLHHRLVLNEKTLWFELIESTDSLPKLIKKRFINPEEIFGSDITLKRKELVERLTARNYKSPDKLLKQWVVMGVVYNPQHGVYTIAKNTNT
jgi:hypothetical protein